MKNRKIGIGELKKAARHLSAFQIREKIKEQTKKTSHPEKSPRHPEFSSGSHDNEQGGKFHTKVIDNTSSEYTDTLTEEKPVRLNIAASDSDDQVGQLSLDIYQETDKIIIVAPIAGVESKNVKIKADNDLLTISGRRKHGLKVDDDEAITQECYWGKFERTVILPDDIMKDSIEAKFKNSVLTITIPRSRKIKTRVINIRDI